MKKLIITSLFLLSVISLNAQENRTQVLQDLEKNQPSGQEITITATLKSASRLFAEKNDLTTVLMIVPFGSVVNVIGSDSAYFHVIFEENEGYILKRHAVIDESPVASKPSVQTREPLQQSQPASQQEVSRFTYLENKYGTNMAARLIAGKIWKGMTSEMVRDSWGKPLKINRVINSNTIQEEWIYNNAWLYIENDTLTDWGPTRK
jgi:hypothetical protein